MAVLLSSVSMPTATVIAPFAAIARTGDSAATPPSTVERCHRDASSDVQTVMAPLP